MFFLALLSAATMVYGAYSQYESGQEAKDIANTNAARQKTESTEAARRLKLQQESTLSEARARAAASGISPQSSTVVTYLDEMQKNFKSEQDWIKKSGTSAADIQARQGEYQARQATAGAWGTIANLADNASKWEW